MLTYAIRHEQVIATFRMLATFTNARIVLYSATQRHLAEFDLQPDSAYCQWQRQAPRFLRQCTQCDQTHLAQAKIAAKPLTYRCHHGLTEGIVPLYDQDRKYLGAIVFGQIRMEGEPPPRSLADAARRLYEGLPVYTREKVEHLAGLLNCLGRYLVQEQAIRVCQRPWADGLRQYVRDHLSEKLTVRDLAAVAERSPSFITHQFKAEMGLTPHQFILRERMARARELLTAGVAIKETARQLGYCDEFHFSKVFKAWHGFPPSRFRASG